MPIVLHGCGPIGKQAAGFDVDFHISQFVLNGLQSADRFPVKNTLIGKLDGCVQARSLQSQGTSHHAATSDITDGRHGHAEPLTLFPQQVFLWYPAVFKRQFTGVASAHTDLVLFMGGFPPIEFPI